MDKISREQVEKVWEECRYADYNGVCRKLSGNGEIIYCIEGPCPYDMPGEMRDDGAHIKP